MRAAWEVARPIAEVESDLVAQGFLSAEQDDLGPYGFPATMLRDADPEIARFTLVQRVRKEFLDNVAGDLEALKQRLEKWIAEAKLPSRTGYSVQLWQDRLSLSLISGGFPVEQKRRWDKGEDWPCWVELIAEVPEMAPSHGPESSDSLSVALFASGVKQALIKWLLPCRLLSLAGVHLPDIEEICAHCHCEAGHGAEVGFA